MSAQLGLIIWSVFVCSAFMALIIHACVEDYAALEHLEGYGGGRRMPATRRRIRWAMILRFGAWLVLFIGLVVTNLLFNK